MVMGTPFEDSLVWASWGQCSYSTLIMYADGLSFAEPNPAPVLSNRADHRILAESADSCEFRLAWRSPRTSEHADLVSVGK